MNNLGNSLNLTPEMRALREYFEGAWKFTRQFTSYPEAQGSASFTPDGEDLVYEEALRLKVQEGQTLDATRSYRYVFLPTSLRIKFSDGANLGLVFLDFVLPDSWQSELNSTGLVLNADHQCGNDTYNATFSLNSDGTFATRYDVSGPAKDYAIISRYFR